MGLFGKKPEVVYAPYVAPPQRASAGPSMDTAIHNATVRNDNLDARIARIDADIANHKREMQRCRPGTATYNMHKRRALQAMKQKKGLEGRAANASNVAFNLEQVRDASQMQRDNAAMAESLRTANAELRAAHHQIDIDEIEDLQDDMADALQEVNEVQESLGRSYGVEDVDEADLEAELDELEQDAQNYHVGTNLDTPSYLQPSTIPSNPTPTAMPNYAPPTNAPNAPYPNRY